MIKASSAVVLGFCCLSATGRTAVVSSDQLSGKALTTVITTITQQVLAASQLDTACFRQERLTVCLNSLVS